MFQRSHYLFRDAVVQASQAAEKSDFGVILSEAKNLSSI